MLAKSQLFLLIALAMVWGVDEARAQFPNSRPFSARNSGSYQPSRPVLPNALNYFRDDVGATDAYHTFVQPRTVLERTLFNQEQQIRFLSRQQRATKYQLNEVENGLSQPLLEPTGYSAQFMNLGGYYPGAKR